jgi:hypothetical protein
MLVFFVSILVSRVSRHPPITNRLDRDGRRMVAVGLAIVAMTLFFSRPRRKPTDSRFEKHPGIGLVLSHLSLFRSQAFSSWLRDPRWPGWILWTLLLWCCPVVVHHLGPGG